MAKARRNKYGAQPRNGSASRREDRRKQALQLLERAGDIRNLRCQVEYELIPRQTDAGGRFLEHPCRYVADFVYERDGQTVVEDSKGFRTPDYRIKRKLMLWVHGIRLLET